MAIIRSTTSVLHVTVRLGERDDITLSYNQEIRMAYSLPKPGISFISHFGSSTSHGFTITNVPCNIDFLVAKIFNEIAFKLGEVVACEAIPELYEAVDSLSSDSVTIDAPNFLTEET